MYKKLGFKFFYVKDLVGDILKTICLDAAKFLEENC